MGSYNFLTLKSSRSDLLKPESFRGSVVDTSNNEQPRGGVNRWESGDIETRSMTWRMKKKSAPCSAIWSCDQMQVRFVCAWSEVWTDVYPFKKIEKAFEKTLKGLKLNILKLLKLWYMTFRSFFGVANGYQLYIFSNHLEGCSPCLNLPDGDSQQLGLRHAGPWEFVVPADIFLASLGAQ